MGAKSYTIGDLARLSGQSVRRIRFYSDRGLLPPSLRTAKNYRLYTAVDVAELDLIRALREAGVELDLIRRLLERKLSLADVLQTRLEILDAEIAARRRMAIVLRATLRLPDPAEDDLRRIWTMSKVSGNEMRTLIEGFYDRIASDASIDDTMRAQILASNVPQLPDDPGPGHLAAWDELAGMLADDEFVREMRQAMNAFWTDTLDPAAYQAASMEAYDASARAVAGGLSPDSDQAATIARHWLERSAAAMGRRPDRAFADWHMAQYQQLSGRIGRYRQLLAELRGQKASGEEQAAWTWLNQAIRATLS
jgi:DNA-binding transcriptional MerR regulator